MENIYEYEDTFGDQASTYTVKNSISTGIMLSTLWNQSGIVNIDGNTTILYNEYCPLDGDTHSLTGCTNTAAAQIIYYFIEKYNLDLKLTLTAEDEYTSNYEGLEIDIKADGSTPGTVSFNAVNSKIANFDIKSADDIAALNYACGVVQKAAYSADATSTAWRTDLFLRSGFYCAIGSNIKSKYYWGVDNGDDSYSISDGGFEVLIENLAAGRVVGTSYPGHALVIDGYDSATDKFHINYGWGDSSSTGWYSRKEMNDQGYYYFMYDLMLEKVTTLTVNDSDLYGTGTMLRAFEQAQGISGDNIIEFTNAVKGKSLVLRDYITFADKTTVNNFNMSVSFTDERYSNYGFYLNSGSTAVFNNFSGEVFVNTGKDVNYAFYAYYAESIEITTNGALIYAGQYKINNDLSAGTAAVQSAMRAYQNNKTAISSNILESRKYSVYGSANSDKVTLDNNTVVIGNVQLNDGNDVLSISGNSHLFGDVYLNSGNDTVSVTGNSHLFGDVYLNSGNDTVSVTGNSHISGDINTGDGSDTVTIDSTSSVTGGFYNIENLRFDLLSQHNTQAMYYVMYNVYNVYSYTTSIVADITLATIGSYLLFEADSEAQYSSYLQNLSITVTGGGLTENTVLNARNNSHCTYADLIYRDNKLYLDVIGYTPGDTTPPSVPGNISSTVAGNGVTISWSAATDNNRVYCYRVRYGKSSELTGDGDVVYDLDTVFSSLANGTYYYQVCAVDASGNKSNWSAVKNFVINYTSAPSTIMSGGLLVSSANVLSDKRLTSGMSMFVSQAGSATRTEVVSGAVQRVLFGGTATSTTVRNGGVMYVSGGGSALDLNLSGGTAYIYNNGSAGNVKIHSDGVLNVSNTAVVSGVYVSSGGKITAPISANVSAVTFASGAAISSFILQAVQYYDKLPDNLNLNNVILSGTAVLSSGAVVKNIEMGYKDKLTVSSGATASIKFNPWRGTVSSAAGASVEYLDREANVYYGDSATGILSKGNTLDNLDITNKQSAAVYSNGLLRNAELYGSGYAHIYGGAANNTTINSGGSMHISEGFANHTQVNSSGCMYISAGGSADNTTVNSAGRVYIYGQAAGMQVTTGGSVNVCSEGILSNGTVTTGGRVNVSSGGSANNMDIAGGSIYISSGASAGTIAVGSSGYAAVYGGGKADVLQVASYGSANVSSGAYIKDAIVNNGGKLAISGEVFSAQVGSQAELTLNATAVYNSIQVNSAGKLYLDACTVNGAVTTERGSRIVLLGHSKSNVNITIKGDLKTTPLSKYTLDMQNHTLTLDLQEHSGTAAYMIDNLANIKNYNLSVTVSASQVSGSYTLARGAKDFTGSITVKCGNLQGSISAGSTLTLGNTEYALALNSSNYLTLTVNNSNTEVHPTTSEYIPGTWSTDWEQASEYARKNNKLIFLFCGEKSACAPTDIMENKLLQDPEFLKLAKNNLVLLHNTNPTDKSYDGSPVGYLLDYNGTSVASRSGFGANYYNSWMEWLKLNLGIGSKGVHIFSGGNIETHNIYSGAVITNQTVYVLGVTIQDWQIEACDVCAGCSGVHIISGGIASNVKINTMGSMSISSGGIANNTTISSGFMTVFSGGTVNNTNIIYYALNISNGGTANNTTASSGGGLNVYSQGIALNTSLSGGYMYLLGGAANSTTVISGGYIHIASGGTANSTTVSFDGYMYISYDGVANSTIVNSGGYMRISSGGSANNTIVNSGGAAVVYNGGYASGGSVDLYGRMSIASGAAAVEIKENGGYVYVAEGANATFAANTVNGLTLNTSMTVHQNTVANNITLDSAGRIYLYGGAANRTTVKSGGYLTISGGKTTSSLVNGGTEDVFTDGTTYNATVMSGGRILLAGGKAVSTIVSSGGSLSARSYSGALSYASDAQILSGGFMDVYDSSTAESTVIEQGGYVRVRNYGSAVSTLIKSGASMYVHSSSGYAYDTVISGFGRVYDGATMSKTVIASGGSFHLWRGGILKDVNVQYGGLLDLRESAPVLAGDVIVTGQLKASYNQNVDASQAKIVADLAPRKTTNDYSIINLDYLGKTNLTVNVDLNQADGTYKLASNAAKWDSALALTVTENYLGKTYTSTLTETLEINQKFLYNNKLYTLSKTSNNLMLDIKTVDSKVPAKPVISISSGSWTNSDVKIKATYCDNSVKKEYSFDQKNWYAYTGEIVVSENKTVYFRGGNEYDVYGAVAAVPITFIDKLNPALTLSVDKTALTNQNVTVTALFNDSLSGIKSVTYLWDGQDGNMTGWLNGDSYTAAGNGTIYFKVVDNANNSVLKSYWVNNIDKTVPELTISGNLSTPTSKVKLSATAADNSGNVTLQYSFDRQNWSNGASLELTENCTVYFRAMDNAGNETLKTLIVSNIDKSAPDKSTVFADITNTTNRDVTVTMIFGSNAVQKEYSLDGKNYLPYPENGVVITQNGTVYFRSIDKAGNISEITEYVVNNIDKLAAAKPVAAADITAATNKNVTVTATFSQDTVVREYSWDNINWNTYTTGIVFEKNGTVYFRSTDEAGNISEITEYVVNNIDKVAPEKPAAAADITELTNQAVCVTAAFSQDTVVREYSLDNINWNTYTTGIVFEENGTVCFRGTDLAGNISETTEYVVSNIDKIAPEKPVAAADITELTNQAVCVTATFSQDTVVREYSLDNINWNTYTTGIVFKENSTVCFRGTDLAGNISETTEYVVSNIDKTAPELNIAGNLSITSSKVKLFISGSDANGISVLQYSFDRQQWVNGVSVELTENCTVYFRAIDNAGNETVKNIVVRNIDKAAPDKSSTYADIINATNKNVTVMAAFDDDTVVREYSFDGKTWLPYPADGVVMTQNGTVYFRSIDQAGNISEITEYTVSNIDKIAPEKPAAAADITALTNKDVTVTAAFSSDSAIKEYSLNNVNFFAYTAGVVLKQNGTVYFRGIDEAGNISEVTEYTVDYIDKIAPEKPAAAADITALTNRNVTVTADFSSDSALKEYSLDNKMWQQYTAGIVFEANGTVYFRGIDEAGNISEVTEYTVDYIDKLAPGKPAVKANNTALTHQNVIVTATFSEDSVLKEYSLDNKFWQNYITAVVMTGNGKVYFRGTDAAGNVSEVAGYEVNNMDKTPPEIPGGFSETVRKQSVTLDWADTVDSGIAGLKGYQVRYGTTSTLFGDGEFVTSSSKVISGLEYGTYYYQVQALDKLGNASGWSEVRSWTMQQLKPANLQTTGSSVSWNKLNNVTGYIVEISHNDFKNSIVIEMSGNQLDISELSFNSKWRVRVTGEDEWSCGETFKGNAAAGDRKIVSNADGNMDLFFTNAGGYWQNLFYARHDGSLNGWKGTQELVELSGKNKLSDVWQGSDDANILLLSDSGNGDALFVDDVYTEFGKNAARISQIDEIRAGLGDDVIDMTSRQFAYIGNGIKIYGGEGNDTIWANNGSNALFGDAGNDRIIGGKDNDVIVGGAGNDSMHGGGGSDIFCFGENWGNDVVEQLADGKVTLWFENGSASKWNAGTLTYTDGANSVKVSGVTADRISLKFGGDTTALPTGAFADAASEKIFEDQNKGFLA